MSMWNFLFGLLLGDAIRKSPMGRFVRPILMACAVGVVIAGLIYTYVVFKAVNERSQEPHVPTNSSR